MATSTKAKKEKVVRAPKAKAVATPAGSMEMPVYAMDGTTMSTIALPEKIFSAPWNPDLVHQVTTALAANKRQNRAHTKNRAEVAGGGKKPWKQKGTGQARHGSSRSPIWRHGGVTFGPRTERDYHEKINRKMRVGALLSVLSRKAKDGEIILVDKFAFSSPKTKEAKHSLETILRASDARLKRTNAALVALSSYDVNSVKSFRNLGNVATEEIRNLNPLTVLSYRYLVIERPAEAFAALTKRTKK